MSLNIQTTLAGEVSVSATGWRNTVAVTIGGHTHKLTAVEAETLALALSATVHSTFDLPQDDSPFFMDEAVMVEPQPSRDFLIAFASNPSDGTVSEALVSRTRTANRKPGTRENVTLLHDAMMAAF